MRAFLANVGGTSWLNPAWSSSSTDLTLSGSTYAVQPLWSNAIAGCATSYE